MQDKVKMDGRRLDQFQSILSKQRNELADARLQINPSGPNGLQYSDSPMAESSTLEDDVLSFAGQDK